MIATYQHIISSGASTYTLDQVTVDAADILVIVNGLTQIPEIDYQVLSDEITFTNPPSVDSDIEIRFFGDFLGYQGSAGIPGPPGPPGEFGYRGSEGYTGSVGYSGSGGSGGGSGTLQLHFGEAPPSPSSNNLWWNTANGELYIYYQDGSSNQWVIANPTQTAGFAGSRGDRGFTGYDGSAGLTGPQGETGHTGSRGFAGYTGSVGIGYAGSSGEGAVGYTGSQGLGYTGSMGIGYTGSAALLLENVVDKGSTSGLVDMDINQAYVFVVTPAGPWQANFTNVGSIPSNKTASFVVMVNQGATAQIPGSVKFDGVTQTVLWQGGTAPTGNPTKKDLISFTYIKSSSNYVLGQLIPFG